MVINKTNQYLEFLIIAFFVIGCTPLLNNGYLYVALCILFLPFFFANYHTETVRNRVLVLTLLLFIAQNVLYKVFGYSTALWGRYPGYLLSFAPLLLMLQIVHDISFKYKKRIFWIVVILMVVNILDSIRISILYPYLDVDSIRDYKDFVSTINLGGSSFFTCSMFFSSVCYMIFLNTKQRFLRLSMLMCVLLTGFYLLFYASKASVVVYYFLSLILIAFAKFTKKRVYFFVILFISIFVIVPFIEVYQDLIIRYIVSISPSARLSVRLVALIDADSIYASTSSIDGREDFWMLSVRTWLSDVSNFLFGIGDHYTSDNPEMTGIGQHSDLLDSLARYGLIGLILIYYIYKSSIKYLSSLFDKKVRLQVLTILLIYLLCGFTKKIFLINIGCMVFLFLPLAQIYLNNNDSRNKQIKRL